MLIKQYVSGSSRGTRDICSVEIPVYKIAEIDILWGSDEVNLHEQF